ncbi:putative Fructosamine kinase-domain-containing protein [Seiridium cardinale]
MALQLQKDLKEHLSSLNDSLGGKLRLDDAVLEVLPPGITSTSVHAYGLSEWSFTARIGAIGRNGSSISFFLKYVAGDLGKHQLEGEFVGMTELHKLQPELVPKPLAWGKLKDTNVPAYFFLIEFKNLVPGLPDPVKLGARLAAMHQNSASPDGHFGFHIQTYDGARLQAVAPDKSWTTFFGNLVAEAYRQDAETNGVWPELEIVHRRAQSHLIPRLIGALESEGRSVKPTLIHGDLWDGNIGVDANTGDPWIFDSAVYYAHNEMELGIWRAERHQLRAQQYRNEYLRNYEASEPKEEWDDRNILYSAKTNFMHSACFAGSPARRLTFNDMIMLIQKYTPWEGNSEEWRWISHTQDGGSPL